MRRRDVLRLTAGLAALASAPAAVRARADAATPGGVLYIPGYSPEGAFFEGAPAREHPRLARGLPPGYDGPVRLLTRLDPAGGIVQALFPVRGHDVVLAPDGRIGFFAGFEHRAMATFDPASLDVGAVAEPSRPGWRGGGHGVFVDGGRLLAATERAPRRGYRGGPEPHFGRISLRDPETLRVVEEMGVHGVDPHELRLLADGEHVAVANYGSTYPADARRHSVPRHIVEPSVTVVSLKTGRLVEKYVTGSTEMELRHLCLADRNAIFAIQAALGPVGADRAFRRNDRYAYERELSGDDDSSYLPAPPLRLARPDGGFASLGPAEQRPAMRHGLSIEYDPAFDEVIATFPASHSIMVFDGASGRHERTLDTAVEGLEYPCGVALLPGGRYAVAGYWRNLHVFERGSHRLLRDQCRYTTFFGHSHMASA